MLEPSPSQGTASFQPPRTLAFLLAAVTFVLFITAGMLSQALSVAFGLWFTEVFVFLGAPWVFLSFLGRSPAAHAGLGRLRWQSALIGFALGVANFFALVVPLQALSQWLAPSAWLAGYDPGRIFREQTTVELWVIVLAITLAAPLCEEFFFRGTLLRGLARVPGRWGAAIGLSALAFSAFHLDAIGFLARCELGLLFGLLFARTGTVWPGAFAHSANNLVSAGIYFLAAGETAHRAEDMAGLAVSVSLGLAGLVGLGIACRLCPRFLPKEPPDSALAPRVGPPSFGRAGAPWVWGAALSFGLFFAIDYRGVALNVYDAALRLPELRKDATEKEREERRQLTELRAAARSGATKIENYVDARREAYRRATGSPKAP